jgi:hypothetical protein
MLTESICTSRLLVLTADLGHQHGRVLLLAQNVADRPRHVGRRERRGRVERLAGIARLGDARQHLRRIRRRLRQPDVVLPDQVGAGLLKSRPACYPPDMFRIIGFADHRLAIRRKPLNNSLHKRPRSVLRARLITARPMTTELGDNETSYRNKQASAARAA